MTFETNHDQNHVAPGGVRLRELAARVVVMAEQTKDAIVTTRPLGTGSVEFTHAIVNDTEVGITRSRGEVMGVSIQVTNSHGRKVAYGSNGEGGVDRRHHKAGTEVRRPVTLDELDALEGQL